MLKKYRKGIITVFMCFAMATILTWVAPNKTICNTANATETDTGEFKGASGKSGGLTWNITSEGHLAITGKGDYKGNYYIDNIGYVPGWLKYSEYIKTAEVNVQDITHTSYMFGGCNNLTSINIGNFNTDKVTEMWAMFSGCKSLTSLDLSNFNTDKVTNMGEMFSGCSDLINLDLSNFKTDKVTEMWAMFSDCKSLTSLDLSNFNTEQVTSMSYMFSDCSGLISLDISSFNTDKVTSMGAMFSNCRGLTSLDLSNFNTDKITFSMENMFSGCSGLISLDIGSFNTDKVTSMGAMFSDCRSLTSLDLSNFNTDKVTSMWAMFRGCNGLTNLDLSNFNTDKVTNMGEMFSGCKNLTSLDLSNFNTDQVTSMSYMFSDCRKVINLDVSNFNTDKVTNMGEMFSNCRSLTSLDVSNFNTDQVTFMWSMFSGCSSLISLDVSNFNTDQVTSMWSMFSGCSGLTSLDLSSFNTDQVTSMRDMFSGCSSLISLDISNFNTNKIGSISYTGGFDFGSLSCLKKLYFFENSSMEYYLPSSSDYYWINDSLETVTSTAKDVDRKVNYYRLKDGEVPAIPTPIPTPKPTASAIPTFTPVPTTSATPIVPSPSPSTNPTILSDMHIFSDYNYNNPITDNAPVIYGNGISKTVDGKKVNNKAFTAYTDITASYKHTPNSNGTVKSSIGKVIVGVTKTAEKPTINAKNKITDISTSKIAKAKIKNGQITVTAVGKEGGLVYFWVIDTGSKGVSAYCPIDVKLAPKKLEVQDKAGSKLKNIKLANGNAIEVCVAGLVGSTKTEDCTYTATVDSKYQSYITVTPIDGSTNKFTIKATGLKNNKDTKTAVTFKCDQNGKKTNFSLTITK